ELWPTGQDASALDQWADRCRDAVRMSWESWEAQCDRPSAGVHPGWLAREVSAFAAEHGDHTFVSDGGDSVLWGIAFSKAHRAGTNLFIGSAMGTLGVGLPFAIAGKASRPDEPVFVFTGDGAFGLSAIELATAARQHRGALVA